MVDEQIRVVAKCGCCGKDFKYDDSRTDYCNLCYNTYIVPLLDKD